MSVNQAYDAVVVGSGPNGLSAAIALARAGRSVLVIEKSDTAGGGARSAELTLPGFVHDPCAAIMPLGIASPFISSLPLEQYGLEWVYSPAAVAHPLDNGRAVRVDQSLDCTVQRLEKDGPAYRALLEPTLADWDRFRYDLLGPLPLPPRSLWTYVRFGLNALHSAKHLALSRFDDALTRAMFAGMSAHSMIDLDAPASGAVGVVISLSVHAVGWPFPRGGAGGYSRALIRYLESLGGKVLTGFEIRDYNELPQHRIALFDVSPRSLLSILGDRLPYGYRRQLDRYRYGVGVCKVDYALDGPVPWTAPECRAAATVHLGGTLEEILLSEHEATHGRHTDRPFVLVAQPSLFDASRAPQGKHTLWAYCHTPNGSDLDVSKSIEAQIERFAPGFHDLILAKHVRTAKEMEIYNSNYVGGDINTGVQDLFQMFTRPAVRLNPYTTPLENIYLCSTATPPGGGVHGMSGFYAAQAALNRSLRD